MKKLLVWLTIFSLVFQFSFGPSLAIAQELTPTPEVTAVPTPAEEIVPTAELTLETESTPTPEIPTITSEPTMAPEPTAEITVSPTEELETPASTEMVLPAQTTPPSPTATSEPLSPGDLVTQVFDNVSAVSINNSSLDADSANSACLITDKADYAPTDSVLITGSNFSPNSEYVLVVSSQDEPKVNFEAKITTDTNGGFVYAYQLDGISRPNYKVEVKDLSGQVLATVTFTDPPPTTNLFFSEYIEGSGNNKALEIYNPNGSSVDLAATGYRVEMYFNGGSSAGLTINLTGSVSANDVYVVAHNGSGLPADQTAGGGWFNGNDAVILKKGSEIVDIVGQIGNDPGTEWGSGLTGTENNTLVRKCGIAFGDSNGSNTFDPSLEWDGYAENTFSYLGSHTALCGGGASPTPTPTTDVCQNLSGAIWTTDSSCNQVNQNQFSSKEDVYLNGGPQGSGQGLPDGDYYVKVTEPDGNLLGDSGATTISVSGGQFTSCFQIWNIFHFADTTNPGGNYKVWVSPDPTFPESCSKTDNFKVEVVSPTPTPTETPNPICGDRVKNGDEECDTLDGVTTGQNFCTNTCQLIPIYDGGYACPRGTTRSQNPLVSTTVSSTNPTGQTVSLAGGKTYLFEASGDYGYGGDTPNNTINRADAGYATGDAWATRRDDLLGIPTTAQYRGITSLLSDMGTGIVGLVDWGTYNSDHVYQKVYTASGHVKFIISDWYDAWYAGDAASDTNKNQGGMWDNAGSLTLNIYECHALGSITGIKFEDKDGNHIQDPGEEGLAGWTIYLDTNQNNQKDVGEPTQVTNGSGNFTFSDLIPGNYWVKEVNQLGWHQTRPTYPYQEVDLTAGENEFIYFGNKYLGFCGDRIKNGEEECDGSDGVTAGLNFCSASCHLIPIYDGEHACPRGTVRSASPMATYAISGTDADGESFSLTVGGKYLFEAIGTYRPTQKNANPALWWADAGYTTNNNWVSLASQYGIHGTGTDYAAHALLADLGSGVGVVDWGNYNPDHLYHKYYEPTTSDVQFVIGDRYGDWFDNAWKNQTGMGDNSGSLTLKVYECQNYGSIAGNKYEDIYANGAKDGNDAGLAGWTIFLDQDGDGILGVGETSTTTDENGDYLFSDLLSDTYRVCEVTKTGWIQTSSPECYVITVAGDDHSNNNFGNFKLASISGMKFEDMDKDGVKDPEDAGLSNWKIYLDLNANGQFDTGEPARLTATDGSYSFTNLTRGDYHGGYSIREVLKPGWARTTPENSHWVGTPSGAIITGKDFGNFELGKIQGRKYEDLNNDSAYNAGEPYLNEWTIRLYKQGEGWEFASEALTGHTGTQGQYQFKDLEMGTYYTCEVLPTGWVQSDPGSVEGFANLSGMTDEASRCRRSIINSSGDLITGKHFGNVRFGSVSGYKYEDRNADTRKGEGERGLSGWTIFIDENGNGVKDGEERSAVTGEDGSYSLGQLPSGQYSICEVPQFGWTRTSAGYCQTVTVNAGQDAVNTNFGNFYWLACICNLFKTNDKLGIDLSPGASVLYTLRFTIPENGCSLTNTTLTDLLPGGFKYRLGSWTAISNFRGDLKTEGITTEPTYASPGTWNLGDTVPGEEITLTYVADIDGSQYPGLYKDLAWAGGTPSFGEGILANADTGLFVGTNANVVKEQQGGVDIKIEREEIKEGQVLGASLPATGANTKIIFVSLMLMVGGLSFLSLGLFLGKKHE